MYEMCEKIFKSIFQVKMAVLYSKLISTQENRIVNNFINFILKRTEGGAAVEFIITLLTVHSD